MLIELFREKFGLSRAFGLGAGVTVVRLICGFISIKVTAVYLGPGGLTLIAQINNFINMTHQVISQGVSTATVRLLSEVKQDVTLKAQLLGTVGSLTAVLVVLAAVLILPLSALIAPWLLHAPGYTWIVVLSVPALAALVVNGVCLSILNSHGENGRVSASLMVSTVLGLALFAPACVLWGIQGGMAASIVIFILGLPITLLLARRSPNRHDFLRLMGRLDWPWAKRILAFYPMLIVHSLVPPLALILIRGMAIESIGPEATGQWQAALRISETYLGLVMTSTSLYFMPQLGTVINSPYRLQREVRTTLAITVTATAAIAASIYFLRVPIIHIVFSDAFVDVIGLMPMQLLGDTLTMIGWTLGYVLVALVRSAWYISLQFLIPIVFYATTRWLIADHGAHAIVTGYAIAGGVHAVLGCFALREVLFRRVSLATTEGGQS